MPTRQVTDAAPETIAAWEKEWLTYFNRIGNIDVGDNMVWDIVSIRLPILFHLAKLGAMINTDDPTAELFRLAMIGLAHENEQKANDGRNFG